ncbi:bifunctional diguanylate cyclase/phosphodiesterase [Marinomonas piezotolerans]|nr:EAL domain-containing protein [Marinomonas piezotolerans]
MQRFQRSILHQLVTYGILITALALFLLMMGTQAYNAFNKYRALSSAMHVAADVIGSNSTAAILFQDEITATEVLHSLSASPDMLRASITLPSGSQLAEYHAVDHLDCPPTNTAKENLLETSSGLQFSWCSVGLQQPINLHGERIGTIVLEYSLKTLRSSILFDLLFGILSIVATLGLSLLLWRRLAIRITRPLRHLSNITQQVSSKQDLGVRAVVTSRDEVGRLTSDFNGMMEKLQQYDVQLKQELQQRRIAEERLNQLAYHDNVTGLYNRHYFNECLDDVIAQSCRNDHGFALLLIDLDGFKKINDTLGHDMGDQLLCQVASRLKNSMRASDKVCRLGGDEFAIITGCNIGPDEAQQLAQKLVDTLASAYSLGDRWAFITGSIGICLCPEHAKDKELLVKYADVAMYQAKEQGKNGYCVYAPGSEVHLDDLVRIEHDIHDALASNQLRLNYEPWFTASERALAGFEAQLYWEHPQLGVIHPTQFIPIANLTGLIVPIGEWVVEQAMQQLAKWKQLDPELKISLPFYAQMLHQASSVERLIAARDNASLGPDDVELVMSEHEALAESSSMLHASIKRLRETGFLMTLDEFGAGPSSLPCLQHVSFEHLKVDSALVAHLDQAQCSHALLQAMVGFGSALKVTMIAQGILNEEQAKILACLGYARLQGPYLCEPVSANAAQALLEQAAGEYPSRNG